MAKKTKLSKVTAQLLDKYSFLFEFNKISCDQELNEHKDSCVAIIKKIDFGDYALSFTDIATLKKYDLNIDSLVAFLKPHRRKVINIIRKKLEIKESLTDIDFQLLKELGANDLLELHREILQEKYPDFLSLKKYFSDLTYYKILCKLETSIMLTASEIHWLEDNQINDLLKLKKFLDLLRKYEVNVDQKSPDLSSFPSSHLCKVLQKIDSNIPLTTNDINFLKKRKLNKTIQVAFKKFHNYLIDKLVASEDLNSIELKWIRANQEDDILLIGEFNRLKKKFNAEIHCESSPDSKLFNILAKLDKNKRLNAHDLAWLQDKKLFYPNSEVYQNFHRIEALFHEKKYRKNKNPWELPSISSHWRKANQSKRALKTTNNFSFEKIQDNKLKSAILTTKGGAFRDLSQLNRAEKCAKRAIKLEPSSHHPYTLMGAICYDRYNHYEGNQWFREAEKRGASRESIDIEIKRSINNMKNKQKRSRIAQKLLKKDKSRYRWAKRYLSIR